ncbi:hypothetical protein HPB48_018959 [Haemaphysalis longicornis]|uniref:Uncharacterized protein n=1 Tax=Haemaphysalis longicornis TaxID=44386 RepID=A0A9J6GWB7_HAELO|nr:hypothetical protein HPB48_018959 [Haemaphysalis longicornis]
MWAGRFSLRGRLMKRTLPQPRERRDNATGGSSKVHIFVFFPNVILTDNILVPRSLNQRNHALTSLQRPSDVLRATRLINKCQQDLQGSLAQNQVRVLHARLTSIQKELDTVHKEIEPLFSEDALEEEYRQMVHKIVHLSILDKFHYLKTSLTGDAAAVLTGLPATSRCYTDVTQLLKQRLGNEELLITEHKKVIDIQPVRDSDDVRGLRRLYHTVSVHIRGLEAFGRKLDTFQCILLPLLQRAIPRDILLDFSCRGVLETRNPTSEPQTNTDGSPTTTGGEKKRYRLHVFNALIIPWS